MGSGGSPGTRFCKGREEGRKDGKVQARAGTREEKNREQGRQGREIGHAERTPYNSPSTGTVRVPRSC